MVSKGNSTCFKLNPMISKGLLFTKVLMLLKGFKKWFRRGSSPMVSKGLKEKVFQCFERQCLSVLKIGCLRF